MYPHAQKSSGLLYSFNNNRVTGQALRRELVCLKETAQKSAVSEAGYSRHELILDRLMNECTACGFLSVHFLCPSKESGQNKNKNNYSFKNPRSHRVRGCVV